MSQNDFTIANQGFPAFRADLNSALQALASNNSGATEPSTMFSNMWWYDSANNIMYIRNEDNDAWIKFAELDQTNDKFVLSGTLQLDDGTVSAPALTFNSDTNMGIYRGGTDILKFVTAGTDAITIDASQNVDIVGTLQVGVDGTTAGEIRLMDSGSVTEEATISSDANGGLIFGGNSGAGELIFRTGSSTKRMDISSGGDISFYEDTGSTPKLFWDSSAESLLADRASSGYMFETSGGIRAGIRSDDQNNLTLRAGTDAIKMHVGADGKVGIGTTSITSKFEVAISDNTSIQEAITIKGTQGGAYGGYLGWKDNWSGDSYTGYRGAIIADVPSANSGRLRFFTANSSTLSERMTIDANGYVTQSKLPMFNIIGGSHTIASTGQTTITSSNGFDSSTEYDPDSLFDHSNGRFTAPVAGRYFFIFSIGIIFTAGYHYSYFFKNGANITGLNRNISQNTQFEVQSIQAVLNLASGDYITAERNNNVISGSVDNAMFSGFLLG